LFVEHPPVITLGRNARREHVLSSDAELARQGIELIESDRGGGVTFHGPGQLVGYPILDLGAIRKDVGWYLRTLEEAIIRALRELTLPARQREGMTGVWIGNTKVAAIGVHLSRWVTSHGFALNVETDLGYFRNIVPCGITCYPVSSLRHLTGVAVSRPWLERRLASHLGELLGLNMEWVAPERGEGSGLCQPPTC
jgi:lipoyl(octanoyl) transferase